LDTQGNPSFEDGRHRFAVLRDAGIDRVAVTVPKDQAAEVQRKFGDDSHESALASIPHGELGYVAGIPVRRTDTNTYRLETPTGHVSGDASTIAARIERELKDQKPDQKRIDAATARAAAWEEPNPFQHPERHDEETKAFHALPRGARVVSLDDKTRGRIGQIVKDDAGNSRVQFDGVDGLSTSDYVEPLDPALSWRRHDKPAPKAKEEQPTFLAENG
jgi:hypothetical protein